MALFIQKEKGEIQNTWIKYFLIPHDEVNQALFAWSLAVDSTESSISLVWIDWQHYYIFPLLNSDSDSPRWGIYRVTS